VPQEKEYILTETRRVFRENKAVSSEKEVAQLVRACMHASTPFFSCCIWPPADGCLVWQIEEAEHRLNYAQHYGIAYPRLHHASQFKRRVYMDVPQQGGSGANISLPR